MSRDLHLEVPQPVAGDLPEEAHRGEADVSVHNSSAFVYVYTRSALFSW